MFRQMIATLKDNPAAVLEDAVGLSAIVVIVMVALHLPVGTI